ncbi:MAG: hypothetical protein IKN54_02455 [Lachnospiraceae bacterium]|nr:hypothetical protein [Lachnospiraceae bacterium]
MFNVRDLNRNAFMLEGSLAFRGYDWWWHSFTAVNATTGEKRQFFIEYFTCNPAWGRDEPILGQLHENKLNGIAPSYLMVKAGCWGEEHCQLHRFFAWEDVLMHAEAPFVIKAGDCYASDRGLRGSIDITEEEAMQHPEWMCDSGHMSWSLTMDKKIAFNVGYGASTPFRKAKAFEMYWHADGIKTLYRGTIMFNGQQYNVIPEMSYGYADKNWGKDFTSPWVWLSSCKMKSRLTGKVLNNSAFDIGGGRPKIYFLPLDRKLLGGLYYEGTEYEYNFSKPWTLPQTKFAAKETDDAILWHVRMANKDSVMDVRVKCLKKDMIWANYEAPDGSKRHNRLWNGGNGRGNIKLYEKKDGTLTLVDDIIVSNIGCEYGEFDKNK